VQSFRSRSGVGGGVQGVQAHPQKLWFVANPGKIPEKTGNSLKIWAKFLKIWEKPLKILEKMAPNVSRKRQKYMKTFIGGHTEQVFILSVGEFVGKSCTKTLPISSGKNPSHPQTFAILPAPAPLRSRMQDEWYQTSLDNTYYVRFRNISHR